MTSYGVLNDAGARLPRPEEALIAAVFDRGTGETLVDRLHPLTARVIAARLNNGSLEPEAARTFRYRWDNPLSEEDVAPPRIG